MTVNFADKTFDVKHILDYTEIRHNIDYECQCGHCSYAENNFNVIGYVKTYQGRMAVFKCDICGDRYRHHVGARSRHDPKEFERDIGLALYLSGKIKER